MHDFNKMSPWKDMRRCILNSDGSRFGYLDADDSNKWEDGTLVDWATVESSGQNCMVEIPKFYSCKKVIDVPTKERIFGVSDKPIETDKIKLSDWRVDPAFYRERNKLCTDQSGVAVEVDFRYAPAFKGWVDAQGRLRSLPNKTPTVNKTIDQFRTHSSNMGNGWGMLDFNLLTAIQILYITEYGNADSQTTIGRGYVDGNSGSIVTGNTRQYGNASFGETTGKKQMSYRGIEDLWGNVYHWVDGLCNNTSREILIGNKGFNDAGAGYKNLGVCSSGNVSGYIGDIQENADAGFVIKTSDGSASSGGYDYGSLYSGQLPIAGGYWAYASAAGVFYCRLFSTPSYSDSSVSAALCF